MAFGHRGAPGHAPENTLVSFRSAMKAGVDAFELDVHPTLESIPVVIHDDTVDRVTEGRGLVREMDLHHIKALDAGHRFTLDGGRTYPYRGKGLSIPTLEEILGEFGPVRLNVDFKEATEAMQDRFDQLIDRFRARDRVLVCSTSGALARRVRRRFPGMATSATPWEVTRLVLLHRLGLGRFGVPRVDAIQVPRRRYGIAVVTPDLVRTVHAGGVAVHVWTVNAVDEMEELLGWGVDGIMSDYPDRLVGVLERLGLR